MVLWNLYGVTFCRRAYPMCIYSVSYPIMFPWPRGYWKRKLSRTKSLMDNSICMEWPYRIKGKNKHHSESRSKSLKIIFWKKHNTGIKKIGHSQWDSTRYYLLVKAEILGIPGCLIRLSVSLWPSHDPKVLGLNPMISPCLVPHQPPC